MAERMGKIEQHNLGPVIIRYLGEGMVSETIAARISADGIPISQPTVARWIKKEREKNRSKAEKLFSEHVERELPKDLDALEEMEAICLNWAREDKAQRCERIMAWNRVYDALGDFEEMILAANAAPKEEHRRAIVSAIVKRILSWVLADTRDQKRRIEAINMAAKIIGGKLQHAGVLTSDKEGFGITIKPYDGSAPLGSDEKSKRHLFAVGSKDGGGS